MDLYDRAAYKFEGGLGAQYAYTTSYLISPEWLRQAHNCILHVLQTVIRNEKKYVLIKFYVSNV